MNFLIPDDMPDKKLTDVEIKSALKGAILNAKGYDSKVWSIEVYKLELALDLINRQKAYIAKCEKVIDTADKTITTQEKEIERLTAENKLLIENDVSNKYPNCVLVEKGRIYTRTLEDYDELIGDISAEAYKTFAEKLEERIVVHLLKNKSNQYAEGFADALDGVNGEINNLLKELIGE